MLPLQQAFEVRQSIIEYLKATFPFKEKEVYDAFFRFVEDPQQGIFKGPYLSLKLPFETADSKEETPLQIAPKFSPYKHQLQAFQRLHTRNGHAPQPTLITTGTGSGKTESFLFPILDYCYQHAGTAGIKVIILYPMNALATDQARRLAETIYNDGRLKGVVTAGLFIGEGKNKARYPDSMGPTHIIENRNAILQHPPDILLTNFKMLDYGLMRHTFNDLWVDNYDNPTLLKFLVLDELHTYDGAQGTDVANLIRRLKLKLSIPEGHLCPIGTSATIGSGEEAVQLLTDYASKVFGEAFTADSVIVEHRQQPQQFFALPESDMDAFVPRISSIAESRLGSNEHYATYIRRQKRIWQIPEQADAVALSGELLKLRLVYDICTVTAPGTISLSDMVDKISARNPHFAQLAHAEATQQVAIRQEVITSLLSLIADAKADADGRYPFLFLQVQLWIREFSGLLREFNEVPTFTWRDKIGRKGDRAALPPYFCRDCGASGWLAVKHDNRNQFEPDAKQVYEYYFDHHKNVFFVNTKTEGHEAIPEYDATIRLQQWVNVNDLRFSDYPEAGTMQLIGFKKVNKNRTDHVCPECNSENAMSIIGTRIPTLNSISVSQVLASDLDDRDEKYRKVLAFSNSVQDAAHQAAIVESRNFRFTFRSSLQKVLNEIGKPVDLATLADTFIAYWKDHADPTGNKDKEAYFYRFFPSDLMGRAKLEEFKYAESGRFSDDFEQEFDLRIRWEIYAEFGYNAIIGRTLEKTFSAGVAPTAELAEQAFEALSPWLEAEQVPGVTKEAFIPFLAGILYRLRTRGSVDHPILSKFRNGSQSIYDLNWYKDKTHYLHKRYPRNQRFPRLITTVPHSDSVLDTTYAAKTNWFHQYFSKSFPLVPYSEVINDFYKALFQSLTALGLMSVNEKGRTLNYALQPQQLFAANEVVGFQCSSCQSVTHTQPHGLSLEGAPCVQYRCTGTYRSVHSGALNYYNLVYNRARSPRIFAAEHTGLLERKTRERVERSFKERPAYNSLNALVATSTLEMGIDIGTLDTVSNTSVPPLVSNFLQRIGRAGRSSGSALVQNFCYNKEHDLFYFAEPMAMMEGSINTPGCFLNAKDILLRHFIAFCFDTWVKEDPSENQIPGSIISLHLTTTQVTSKTLFFNRYLDFVGYKYKQLLSRFRGIYGNQVDTAIFDDIENQVVQGQLSHRIVLVFSSLRNELLDHLQQRDAIDTTIREQKLGKEDETYRQLMREKSMLSNLLKKTEKRSVLEHMTNMGLLPNYAFPETGVTLTGHVYAFKPEGAIQEPKSVSFEIVRPASAALSEFAPDNFFYSQGYKLEIKGLQTYDWGKETDTLMDYRFCSNCDHLEAAVKTPEPACPKCGHSSWSAASNVHKFARIHGVKSENYRQYSALSDDGDERTMTHYKVSTHFRFDDKSIHGTYGMKKIPFGIEYVTGVTLNKVNLGAGVPHADHLTINQQEEIARHGFVVCRVCGKATSNPRKVQQTEHLHFHFGYCRHRGEEYPTTKEGIFEEVFLYRSFQTEAIKILLPVQEFMSEATQHMFKAGLERGLKQYYNGNPDHIALEFYSEFNRANGRFDRYLVAYDKVPGGTGYLQKLFNQDEFTKLLRHSYDAIRTCSCRQEGKDGCYRCILSYSNQYVREHLSRQHAEELFKRITESADQWEEIPHGLSSMTKSGAIEESELERKFVYALQQYCRRHADKGFAFRELKENGIIVYHLTVPCYEGKVTYLIRPQVELGEAHGLPMNTRTDFLLRCIALEQHGEAVEDIDRLMAYREVAVYMDGFVYHASNENLRFTTDIAIRDAIAALPNLQPWSLSWDDVVLFEREEDQERQDKLVVPGNAKVKQYLRQLRKNVPFHDNLWSAKNSIERLLWYLGHSASDSCRLSVSSYLATCKKDPNQGYLTESDAAAFCSDPHMLSADSKAPPSDTHFMITDLNESNELYKARIMVRLRDLTAACALHVADQPRDIVKDVWVQYWQLYNLVKVVQ